MPRKTVVRVKNIEMSKSSNHISYEGVMRFEREVIRDVKKNLDNQNASRDRIFNKTLR